MKTLVLTATLLSTAACGMGIVDPCRPNASLSHSPMATASPSDSASTINTIPAQTAGAGFTVAGAISGLSSAPTLQYQDNGGAWASINGASGIRDPANQPGGNRSAWNTPFGNQATWGAATDTDTIDIARGWNGSAYTAGPTGVINGVSNYGFTYWIGAVSDPTYTVTITTNGRIQGTDASSPATESIHIPNGAYSPGPYPGDNSMGIFDRTNNRIYGFGYKDPSPGLSGGGAFSVGLGEWDDATSDTMGHDWDTGLSGYIVALGAINVCDVSPTCNPNYPNIHHALRYSTDAHLLKSCTADGSQNCPGTSWPQRQQDHQSGINVYSGNLVAGTTLGIPLSTQMPTGLDANCQGAFWTMQHYPLFFRDQAGGGFHLTVDQTADTSAYVTSLRNCLPTLVALLRPLRNQHAGGQSFTTSPINGPGTRVDTGPNPLTGGTGGISGASVSATSFSFPHPGMPAAGSNTISIRDASNPTVVVTSNVFAVTRW
jgi:hypothetical protein